MSEIEDKHSPNTAMTDDEMVEVHTELNHTKHPPTKGFLQAPLIFVFVFGCLIFVCSIQLAHSTNQFQLHPPQEVVELTEEEKEAKRERNRLAKQKSRAKQSRQKKAFIKAKDVERKRLQKLKGQEKANSTERVQR